MKKKILIITNHSYILYRFRKELIAELAKENGVVLSMPFVGHEDDFLQPQIVFYFQAIMKA